MRQVILAVLAVASTLVFCESSDAQLFPRLRGFNSYSYCDANGNCYTTRSNGFRNYTYYTGTRSTSSSMGSTGGTMMASSNGSHGGYNSNATYSSNPYKEELEDVKEELKDVKEEVGALRTMMAGKATFSSLQSSEVTCPCGESCDCENCDCPKVSSDKVVASWGVDPSPSEVGGWGVSETDLVAAKSRRVNPPTLVASIW